MLALLGTLMIVTFMVLIMTKRTSAPVALIIVPVIFGGLSDARGRMGEMVLEGMTSLAPTAAVLMFAVLYFGIMIDAGLFDPLVKWVLRFTGSDPLRITLGTAAVVTLVSLDGDGATTALVTIGAFLPVYLKLGMNPLIIALLLGLINSIINIAPWGGPAARVAAALQVDMSDIFIPLIPVMGVGLVAAFGIATYVGMQERRRLGVADVTIEHNVEELLDLDSPLKRPKLVWVNLGLTVLLLAVGVLEILPLPLCFMLGLAAALLINYPNVEEQKDRIAAHATNVVAIILLIFSAAVFVGIFNGSGMVDAIAAVALEYIPEGAGPNLAVITALMSGPLTFVMSNDAYYFGLVPVIAETASHYGISAEQIARASLLGQPLHALSPLIAAIYLVAGLLGVEVGALQSFALKWAALVCVILTAAALVTGAIG